MEQLDALGTEISFATEGNQYLTFRLGDEEYGIEILKVQEIKGYAPVTPVPNTPAYVKGVMDLRGTVIPVLDLRGKLAMPEAPYNPFTVIVVVTVGSRRIGLIVDGVSDVLNIPPTEMQAMPDFGSSVDAQFMSGMAKAGERLVVLLDIDTVLAGNETLAVGTVS